MFVMLRKRGIPTFFLLVVVTMLLSGVLVWVLGPSGSNHVSALLRCAAPRRAAEAEAEAG
jgi:hypothetical protein